ncbi:tRNA uridine(34) hydroxylase-like [Emydura macquarii macquarii]|uniref:tRNA uridine(34) hydroxylase-like n=1 Tax=Emydura macquarii macquarii TaxID=1129001 RepID=UPI00352A37FF
MATQFLQELDNLNISDPKEIIILFRKWLQKTFPNVESVTTETLQYWMEEKPEELIILDTRSAAEFEVSHLPGAILVDPQSDDLQDFLQKQLHPEIHKSIVCYCTAGYRSSMTAQSLNEFLSSEASQTPKPSLKVYNAEGGLIKWASERKLLVDKQENRTHLVHPYNEEWAKLLEPELQAQI